MFKEVTVTQPGCPVEGTVIQAMSGAVDWAASETGLPDSVLRERFRAGEVIRAGRFTFTPGRHEAIDPADCTCDTPAPAPTYRVRQYVEMLRGGLHYSGQARSWDDSDGWADR